MTPVLRRAVAAVQEADKEALLLGAVGITAQPSHPIGTHIRSTVPGYPWKGVLVKPDPDLPECPFKVKWANGMVEACLEDEIVVLRGGADMLTVLTHAQLELLESWVLTPEGRRLLRESVERASE